MPRDPITRVLRPLTGQEALNRHVALVQYDRLGLRLSQAQDRFVYHYTNVVGLRGILDTRTLWASDHRFLNDASEILFGLQILEMFLATPFSDELRDRISPSFRHELLMALAMLLEGRLDSYVLSVSFCRKGNLLSQWRAYAGRDGLAIGFNRAFLEGRASSQSYVTGQVHYYFAPDSGSSLETWLFQRLANLTEMLDGLETIVRADVGANELDLVDNLVQGRRTRAIDRWLLETASFIKHPAFSEEAEWRCVCVVERRTQGATAVHDRPSGTRVVPYANFVIGGPEDRSLGIQHVVIGPNADVAALEHAVSHMFSVRGIELPSTTIPYNPLRF